jgi:hypothetical protein
MNAAVRSFRSLNRRVLVGVRDRVQRSWEAAYQPWRRFWFEPADPTPLCVMRILFGGMLLYTHIVWGLNLEGFFGANGWQGTTLVRTLQADQFAWSFWWWIPGGLHVTGHVLCLAILAMFMLGAFTPVTSVLAYLITISYSSRAPMANYGLDQINGIAALYLAIGPSGRALSLDRWRERFRAARGQIALGLEPAVRPVEPSTRANLALRLIQVHLCVIYIFACLSKLPGESWWNGTAIWRVVSNLEYQSRDLTWLAWYPWLVNLLTHATIAWEMTFWALVWRPLLRPFVLSVGVAIHLGIGAFLGMWTFGLAVIFMYVAFIPGRQISAILRRAAPLVCRVLRSLRLGPDSTASLRARAAWFALGLDSSEVLPAEDPGVSLGTAAPSVAPTSMVAEVVDTPAQQAQPTTIAPPGSRKVDGRIHLLPTRPSVLLIEGRVKRQAEVQEYFLKHGFRCSVASELHQARSMLAVIEFDVLVVTSSWFPEHELAEFHDALIGGGSALPASVFLVGSPQRKGDAHGLQESPRHRVLVGSLSMRELRLLVLEVLGRTEASLRPFAARAARSKNGRHPAAAPDSTPDAGEASQSATHETPSVSGGNGSPS